VPFINIHATGRLAILAVACAALPLLVSATAHAEPDPAVPPAPVDARAQCEAPDFGGVFVPDPANPALAECQYIVEGLFYYDTYDNGVYTGTLVHQDGAKVPTERPQMPEQLGVLAGLPPFFG
jgi:hypothetical protein